MLSLIIHEVDKTYRDQFYLATLYKALFALGYYGLFRVGKLTFSEHVAKASNVHIGVNKQKILVVLYSSKTHGKTHRPQQIKITGGNADGTKRTPVCPFKLTQNYISIRGSFHSEDEPLFIFRDGKPVQATHANKTLKNAIHRLGLDSSIYGFHSLRIGRTTDLLKVGYSIEKIKELGRWKSNAVYRYLHN